ncbi:MAG: hypothetical protein WDO73_07065 [Ignavibacteriota bacterium]
MPDDQDGVRLFLLLLPLRLTVTLPACVAQALVPPQFAPHRWQRRFRDGDLMRQYFERIFIALTACIAMLSVQFLKIGRSLRIQAPERIANRAGFHHGPMLLRLLPAGLCRASRPPFSYTESVPMCHGSFRALLLYDIAEEFDVAELRRLLGGEPPARAPGFKLSTPEYVRFERPPLLESCEPIHLATGESANASLRYFDYGVVSLEIELPFETDWPGLIALSNRWIETGEVEKRAIVRVRERVARLRSALKKPYAEWIDEAYYIVELREVHEPGAARLTAQELVARYGAEVGMVIRGEAQILSEVEQKEVLASSLSYYPSDLLVVGWLAAIVYDNPEGAAPLIQLLEYANTQLLEYRRYDEILTDLLKKSYTALERRGGFFSRWRLARDAEQLNRLRLDVTELTERADNAIKFLSDMFYARAYRLAAAKVGAGDYRSLVDQKLHIAGELYEFMVDEFREARGFFLEVLVIVILIIELVPIFRGK